jgi:ribosomal protein S18 acetylase RimI-like enzyme
MRATGKIRIQTGANDPQRVNDILRALPEWFELEDAISDFVEQARTLPSYLAVVDDAIVGVCLLKHHTPYSSEIHLMAVEPRCHRRGIGSALVAAVEQELIARRVEFLQVKTLGPSYRSPEYEMTRLFYEAVGFRALEEIDGLWPDNPCLIMVKHLPGSTRGAR